MIRVKTIFMKNLVPKLTAKGYQCCYKGKNHFEFANDQHSIIAVCRRSPISSVKRIETYFWLKCGLRSYLITLSMLNYFGEQAADELYYESEDELLDSVNTFASQILITLDHLERIADGLVSPDPYYYGLLADDTQDKAKSFAEKHHLDFSYSLKNVIYIENLLKDRFARYRAAVSRKSVFEEDLDEIISLCAYLGELYRIQNNGIWDWNSYELCGQQVTVYTVMWETEQKELNGPDILPLVIEFINLGPEKIDPYLTRDAELE